MPAGPFKELPISSDVRPPFEVLGPNGREYFDILYPAGRVAQAIDAMVQDEVKVARIIRRTTNPATRAEFKTLGEELQRVRRNMETELTTIGVETAAYGTKLIKSNVRKTNVRPDRTGRLEKAILCEPIPTGIPTAAVGIAAIDVLKRGTRVKGLPDGYWASMEFGFTLSARIVPGYFMPGYARPSASQFRDHPFFKQFQYARGMPAMNIVNDIDFPGRNFIRGSLDDIWMYRHQRIVRLRQITGSALGSVSAGTDAATSIAAAVKRYGKV